MYLLVLRFPIIMYMIQKDNLVQWKFEWTFYLVFDALSWNPRINSVRLTISQDIAVS